MNKDIKKEWIEALRSKEYVQGNGYLNHEGEHCCLGVLCELYVDRGLGKWEENDESPKAIMSLEYLNIKDEGVLIDSVKNWAGLKTTSGEVYVPVSIVEKLDLWDILGVDREDDRKEEYRIDLTELNDGGVSFEQISDIIEVCL